ncbi:hypothetical protein D5086_032702 [Populus alba]|uniref:Uncharacterized protein n=1 Tax=Populus alba TaxID=43335 RepID=A0ACC4AES7_POPAL
MSPANSCALLLLFFLTLSLHINFSTADNTNIGVSRRTVAVAAAAAADTVPLQKDVATFLPSDISPPTEKYCYSSAAASQRTYKQGYRSVKHKTAMKSALPDSTIFYLYNDLHPDTEVYEVPLVGADGTKVKAVTVCHLNTSAWSPDHMAFQVLKIKPGPAVCHFLDSDTLVWVPKKD